ncbi:MAG: DUF433 domain-containing protein [Verrucomicrobiota bacterium]
MNQRIQITPDVCHGKPVFHGTRILVSTVLGALAAGDSVTEVLEDYPPLTEEDISAAFEFAGQLSSYQTSDYEAVE